jgi:hypothetical protein
MAFNNGDIKIKFGPNQSENDGTTVQISADEPISFSKEDGKKTLTLDEAESNATIWASSDDDVSVSSDGSDIHMDLGGDGDLHISPDTDKFGMIQANNSDITLGIGDDSVREIIDNREQETDVVRPEAANGDPETADDQERDAAYDNRANGGLSW